MQQRKLPPQDFRCHKQWKTRYENFPLSWTRPGTCIQTPGQHAILHIRRIRIRKSSSSSRNPIISLLIFRNFFQLWFHCCQNFFLFSPDFLYIYTIIKPSPFQAHHNYSLRFTAIFHFHPKCVSNARKGQKLPGIFFTHWVFGEFLWIFLVNRP